MDIDEKKSVELSFRDAYHIIHALPKLINHLKLQDILKNYCLRKKVIFLEIFLI